MTGDDLTRVRAERNEFIPQVSSIIKRRARASRTADQFPIPRGLAEAIQQAAFLLQIGAVIGLQSLEDGLAPGGGEHGVTSAWARPATSAAFKSLPNPLSKYAMS